MLEETFIKLLKTYSNNTLLINELWTEIKVRHSEKKRHYHTLTHLDHLLKELSAVKDQIKNWDVILFSLYYHDIIYNPLKDNNEEKSAELAEIRLESIGIPSTLIHQCSLQILATKKHLPNTSEDTNYFTDVDLSVLGQDWDTYSAYTRAIRKEYSIYPDLIYNPGRKKVLQHFLKMDRIYKTAYFYLRLEERAKSNLQRELEAL